MHHPSKCKVPPGVISHPLTRKKQSEKTIGNEPNAPTTGCAPEAPTEETEPMPPGAAAVAATSQQADCCGGHGAGAGCVGCDVPGGNASCSYLPLHKRLSVDGKVPTPRICIWECDGEAGDMTCDIVAAPLRHSCSARAMPSPPLFRRMMTPPPSRPRPPQREVGDDVAVRRPGETISKGHRSYGLMLNLHLGVSYSVGKSSALPFTKLSSSDFEPQEKLWTRFPPEGSKLTPPQHSVDFRWKDYCPTVFRHLRKLFYANMDFGHLEKIDFEVYHF